LAEGVVVSPLRRARPDTVGRAGSAPPANRRERSLPPAKKRTFRVPEIVLGVFIVAGCALGAVLWQRSTNETSTVVVASRHIARGSVIGPDDLRGAAVGGETSAMISGSSAKALLGKIALVDIDPNAPLTLSMLTDDQPLGPAEALTGVALQPGDMPPDLAPGDQVRVVVTGRADATGVSTTAILDDAAVVWSVDQADDASSTIVTVRGPLAIASAVAAAADVRLVRVDGG
jgi:Flp pilus assembly protein CpaB